eukprot:12415750-Karenia_brevis.AAC.1
MKTTAITWGKINTEGLHTEAPNSQHTQGFQDDAVNHLIKLGLSREDAMALHEEIVNDGPLMKQMGVNDGITELLRSIHTNSWYKYGDSEEVIVCNQGGRQGCKLGGVVFNLIYAKALRALRQRLQDENILLRLHTPKTVPFWAKPGENQPGADACTVAEATFVDDEA